MSYLFVESVTILRKDRGEMLQFNRTLNETIDTFESDFVRNMAPDEAFIHSPQKMQQLIEQVDMNVHVATSALAEVNSMFTRVGDQFNTDMMETTAFSDAELSQFQETLPSQKYNEKLQKATSKLSDIFVKGKVQYDVMKALGTDWAPPVDSKHDDSSKSVESSIVAALQRRIQQMQVDLQLQTAKAHSLSVQWYDDC